MSGLVCVVLGLMSGVTLTVIGVVWHWWLWLHWYDD